MKKYIKLVIGLILILILLTPIFALFNLNIERVLNQTYSNLFEEDGMMEKVEDSIEMQKSEIELSTEAYILEEMVVQLKSLANDSLIEEHQVEIIEIDFEFYDEQLLSYENLDEIIVYLQTSTEKEGEVQTVEQVIIDTKEKQLAEDDEEIIEHLRDSWELTEKTISIYWEGGAS